MPIINIHADGKIEFRPSWKQIKNTDFDDYTAEEIYNKIRALQNPYPNPYILCKDNTKLFITKTYAEKN